eukprot:2968699-Rhodomonas_salina.1
MADIGGSEGEAIGIAGDSRFANASSCRTRTLPCDPQARTARYARAGAPAYPVLLLLLPLAAQLRACALCQYRTARSERVGTGICQYRTARGERVGA